jgi:hypothetical protein
MDGINPTLAFAALFLGLSGHPRDAAQDHRMESAFLLTGAYDCAEFATVSTVPPAVPVGSPMAADEQELYFDYSGFEPLAPLPEEGAGNETGCGTSAPQP